MNTQAVVVLGGAGLIGSLISRILKQYGYIVRVVDRRPPDFDCEFHEMDVTQPFNHSGAVFRDAIAVVFALPERRRGQRDCLGDPVLAFRRGNDPHLLGAGPLFQSTESSGAAAKVCGRQPHVFAQVVRPGAHGGGLRGRRANPAILHRTAFDGGRDEGPSNDARRA